MRYMSILKNLLLIGFFILNTGFTLVNESTTDTNSHPTTELSCETKLQWTDFLSLLIDDITDTVEFLFSNHFLNDYMWNKRDIEYTQKSFKSYFANVLASFEGTIIHHLESIEVLDIDNTELLPSEYNKRMVGVMADLADERRDIINFVKPDYRTVTIDNRYFFGLFGEVETVGYKRNKYDLTRLLDDVEDALEDFVDFLLQELNNSLDLDTDSFRNAPEPYCYALVKEQNPAEYSPEEYEKILIIENQTKNLFIENL